MTQLSRRNFLRCSALTLAAGTCSVPMISSASGTANDKISVGIIGVRGRGASHIDGFLNNPHTVITYICDVDKEAGERRVAEIEKKQHSRPRLITDLRDLLKIKDVDVISTATPNHWHGLIAIWAMQAGKDVYVEKPACQNVYEGRVMVAAARKYNRICQVGTQCRSNPAIRNAVKFIHDGGIGKVNFARGLCYKRRKSIGALGNYPIPQNVDFNLWSGPAVYTDPKCTRKQFHYDWHWQRLYGNGDSGNQGPHQADIARWGLGIMRQPNSVITYGGRLGYQAERKDPKYIDAGDTPNTEVSIYDYGDKTLVFETRGLATPDLRGAKIGVIFYGSEGTLVQDSYSHCCAYDKAGKVIREFKGGNDLLHYDNFVQAVKARDYSILNADILEGHLSACIAHLGNISYYLGEQNKVALEDLRKALDGVKCHDDNVDTLERTVEHLKTNKVDLEAYPLSLGPQLAFSPEKEEFTDNPAANALCTREYRDEFTCPKIENL